MSWYDNEFTQVMVSMGRGDLLVQRIFHMLTTAAKRMANSFSLS